MVLSQAGTLYRLKAPEISEISERTKCTETSETQSPDQEKLQPLHATISLPRVGEMAQFGRRVFQLDVEVATLLCLSSPRPLWSSHS